MESGFQFTNPSLTSFEFMVNEDFGQREDSGVNVKINIAVNVDRLEDKNEARVSLKLVIGDKSANMPFFINATEAADFRWDDSLDMGLIDKLLHQNAPSLLLSYLRPVVVQITSASQFDTFNIPFMNFVSEE